MISIITEVSRNHYEVWGKEAKSLGAASREAFSS